MPVTAELFFQLQAIGARTFQVFPVLVAACLWYLILCSLLMVGQHYLNADLKSHRRVHAVTGNSIPAQQILHAGFSSASTIAVLPAAEFAAISHVEIEEAAVYHTKSVDLANAAALKWFAIYDQIRDKVVAPVSVIPSRDQFFRPLEGYASLLSDEPWCQCEKCQSVLSPAAYFVDLMYFIEQNILRDASRDMNLIRCTSRSGAPISGISNSRVQTRPTTCRRWIW